MHQVRRWSSILGRRSVDHSHNALLGDVDGLALPLAPGLPQDMERIRTLGHGRVDATIGLLGLAGTLGRPVLATLVRQCLGYLRRPTGLQGGEGLTERLPASFTWQVLRWHRDQEQLEPKAG